MVRKLPKGWHAAKDPEGNVYYYNKKSNQSTYTHPTQLTENSESAVATATPRAQDSPDLLQPGTWPVARRLYMIKGHVFGCFRGCLTTTVTSSFFEDGMHIQNEKRYCCYPSFRQDVFVPKKRLRAITVHEADDPRLYIFLGLIFFISGVILFAFSFRSKYEYGRLVEGVELEASMFVVGLLLLTMAALCFLLPFIKGWCFPKHYVHVATDDHPADGSGFFGIFYDPKYTFAIAQKPDNTFLQGYLCTATQVEDKLLKSSKVPPAMPAAMPDSSRAYHFPVGAVSSTSEEPEENV